MCLLSSVDTPLNPHDIQFMAACLPLAGGDVVDDRVLLEVADTVVLLGGLVD